MPQSEPPIPRSGPPVNIYVDWALATNFRYCRPGKWVPLLVQFDRATLTPDDEPLRQFARLDWLGVQWKDAVKIAEPFLNPPDFLRKSKVVDFCVLSVLRERIRGVVADAGWRKTILQAELGPPSTHPLQAMTANNVSQIVDADRVLIGVIDEGIAYAHERFRDGPTTRIEYLWRQDSGSELDAVAINQALARFTVNGRTDEERLYQALGDIDYSVDGFKALARRRSHGTHVLDLAAGASSGAAPKNRPIVAVELPPAMVADPSLTPLYAHIMSGIVYVLLRAQQLAGGGRLPVVVNVSYGPHHGPHDGQSLFESLLEMLIALAKPSNTPLTVVLAAGNFRQSRVHARRVIPRGSPAVEIGWRLQPEDRTPSFVEFWADAGKSAVDLVMTVTSPSGDTRTVSAAQLNSVFTSAAGAEIFRATYEPVTISPGRSRFSVITAPTAADPPLAAGPLAPAGQWIISLVNRGASAVTVEGWIGRDGPIGGRRPLGRQSYFDDATYGRYDATGVALEFDPAPNLSKVLRSGTLSGIATGVSPLVIGAFQRKSSMPTSYSSMGPASGAGTRQGPDALAAGDDSLTCPGILAAGTRSGSVVPMNGTSVAAPKMTRCVADQVAVGAPALPPLNPPPAAVPPALQPKVVGGGLLAASPYVGTPLRNQRP